MLGLPPQTRTQETFREKFLGTSKAFAKIKWCNLWEILWLTFLIRKVSQIIDATFLLYSVGDMPYLLWKRLLK